MFTRKHVHQAFLLWDLVTGVGSFSLRVLECFAPFWRAILTDGAFFLEAAAGESPVPLAWVTMECSASFGNISVSSSFMRCGALSARRGNLDSRWSPPRRLRSSSAMSALAT